VLRNTQHEETAVYFAATRCQLPRKPGTGTLASALNTC